MKTKNPPLIALTLAAALSASAADFSIEGRLLQSEAVQASVETSCTVSFYRTEDASGPLYETNGVRLVTDANGCFVISASAPDRLADLPDTFWVGVKPSGREEIRPRFRVAPVPFAFASDEAQLISTDKEFELAGTATIDRLDVSGDVETEDFVVMANSVIKTKNLKLDSAKIKSITIPNAGILGIFNAKGATPSFDYDKVSSEKAASVETHIDDSGSWYTYDHARDKSLECSYTFEGDGFLLVAIKAEPKRCPAPRLSVRVGGTVIYNRAVGGDMGGVVKRFMTVPYRSGEEVSLKLTASGGGIAIPFGEQDYYRANIGVKLQLVKFGRD